MKATEFKTIAKDAASNQLAQAFAAAKTESEPAFNPQRRAYQGETLLSANRSVSCDTWRSGLNNNVLVYPKPNKESLESIREADEIARNGGPTYASAKEMFEAMGV